MTKSTSFRLASLLWALALLCGPVRGDQKFAIEAEDVTAVLGTNVTLPCRVVQRQGVLQWTKDDFGLGLHRNLSAFDRYSMVGSDEEGDYSLRIDGVQLEDDARYQCQVSPGPEGQPGIRSRFVQLTVLMAADPPRITQGDFLLVTEGNELEVECVAEGGKPAAELTWIDGAGNSITKNIRRSTEPLPGDPRRLIAKSVLRLRVRKQMHNTTLLCQSQNSADRHFKTAEVKVEVKYAPKLKLVLQPRKSSAEVLGSAEMSDSSSANSGSEELEEEEDAVGAVEGHEARFVCVADANPEDITYKWFVNNELVVGDYTTEMVIHIVNRSHHEAVIKCEATNDIGYNEASMKLKVKFPPVFRQPLRSVEADEREKVKLFCDVDGNPLEIVWVHDPIDRLNNHPRVVGTNATLQLVAANETAGRYYCKASVPGYPEIKAESVVYVKRAPRIESARQQFGARGDTIRLRCAAFSVPKARHVSWSYGGREIQAQQDRDFGVEEENTGKGITSTLVIRRSEEWHFGKYNCTVVNDYGVDVLQIELVQQNNFQFLMIVVGATTGVIFLVIVVILVLCVKLKGKRDMRSPKEKEFSADIMPEKHDRCWNNGTVSTTASSKDSAGDGTSSHSSDYKPDIKAGSSESDYSIASTNIADSTLDFKEMRRNGSVPLAEPIELPLSYRHSVDYADSYYPPKYAPPISHQLQHPNHSHQSSLVAGQNSYNNSYVTRTDYARYCAPQSPPQSAYQLPVYGPGSAAGAGRGTPQQQQQQQQQQHLHSMQMQQHQQHPQPQTVSLSMMPSAAPMQMATAVPVQLQDNGLPGARSSLIV